MKYLLSLLMLVSFACQAQTKGKATLYAFKEPVSQGKVPDSEIDEAGTQTPGLVESGMNYFIYLQNETRVYPSEMWIQGLPFSVIFETVAETPVTRSNYNNPDFPQTVTLVPQTQQRVLQLIPAPPIEDKLSSKGKALAKTNDVVVVYKAGSAFYYAVSSLKLLEGAVRQ